MSDKKFVHLNFHSEYSMLESCCSISEIKAECVRTGNMCIAITDTGVMSGIVKFYKECISREDKKGNPLEYVKPIIGSKMYVCDDIAVQEGRDYFQAIFLAQNEEGYNNLKRLSNTSHVEGYYYKPRIDFNLMSQNHKGLICISTGINSSVQKHARRGNMEEAMEEAAKFHDIFGDRYYIDVQNNGQSDQEVTNRNVIKIGEKMGCGVVATNDVRYFRKNHHLAHLALLATRDKKSIKSEKFSAIRTKERYLKTADEMYAAFEGYPEYVLTNTLDIADSCDFKFEFGGMRLPEFDLPDGFSDDWEYLKHLSYKGLEERGFSNNPEYFARLEEELFDIKMINDTKGYNFARYFLIVWDYVNHAQNNGCRVGIGRGCFSPESLVKCSDCIKEISKVKKGDEVLSYDGAYHEVLNTLDFNVEEDLIHIELDDGRSIKCTADHKIHVVRDEELVWVEAKDLNEEDELYDIEED